ncbi:MAG: RDD family protein, partial [Planctomycetes bacterium]|nr:RDD family protein [Planctomycetota bacterium]
MERRPREIHVAASEHRLWLVVVNGSQSRLFFRDTAGGFDVGRSTRRRIVAQTALDRDLLVFFDDGAVYRYSPAAEPPTAESVLPQRETPLDIVGGDGRVYAIIPSAAAAELPSEVTGETDAPPQTFDPGNSAYSLAVFDGRTWSAVAALPTLVRPPGNTRLRPRLCLVQDKLLLLTPGEQPDQVHQFYFDRESREWLSREPIRVPRLAEFRVVNFSRVPTLVTVLRWATQGEEPGVFRLLGNVADANTTSWQPARELELSDLPDDLPKDVVITRYTDAVGFNQHLGLLAWTADGEVYLRFARIDDPPAERTFSVEQALAGPGVLRRSQGLFQGITFVLLLAVLTGLFVFRRGSMIRVVELPPGCALALNVQRLAAWLIDFAPFTIAAAAAVGIPWGEGLGALGRWGISPNPESGLPEENVLLWWGLSVAGYTMYSLVMELIAGRTVGKVIARVRLISEAGTRPTAAQILA